MRAAVNKLLLETKAEKLAAWSAGARFDEIDPESLQQLKSGSWTAWAAR